MVFCQADSRRAKQALSPVCRAQKPRRAVGHQHIVLGCLVPLGVVAVQQGRGGAALTNCGQLPGEVVGILHARVSASCAERADHMRRVTGKKHPPTAQRVDAFAAVGVGAHPDNLAFIRSQRAAKLGIQALPHHVFATDRFGVGIWRHLVVNAPDAIGHQVLPDGAALVKRRFNPGVALDRWRVFKTHIGNTPAVIAFFGRDRGLAPGPKRAARAGAVNHVFCLQRVGACRCGQAQGGHICILREGRDAVAPAQVDQAVSGLTFKKLFNQKTFDIKLLDIDKRRLLAQ